jgi:hypothetical protein
MKVQTQNRFCASRTRLATACSLTPRSIDGSLGADIGDADGLANQDDLMDV